MLYIIVRYFVKEKKKLAWHLQKISSIVCLCLLRPFPHIVGLWSPFLWVQFVWFFKNPLVCRLLFRGKHYCDSMQDFFPTVWHDDMKIAEMEMLLWFFFVGHEYIYVKNHIICQNKCKQYKAKKTSVGFFLPHVQLQCLCSVKV